MFRALFHICKKFHPAIVISIILFIIPFFWLKPGEMDLGGDESRLFFYDPITYLKTTNFYNIRIEAKGIVEYRYYDIPYVGTIALLKFFLSSPTLLISTINGLKLAGAFISMYLIVYAFLKDTYLKKSEKFIYAAILAGIFYVVSLGSFHLLFYWERSLTSHNEVFLNPLMFFLLFKFFLTNKYWYLLVALLISFIFAPNFGLGAAPAFFAFYPLALLFLFLYMKVLKKRPIPWKGIFIGSVLFLTLHSIHFLGQVVSLFERGSSVNSRVFDKSEVEQLGVSYFSAVSSHGRAILNFLLPSEKYSFNWASFISPVTIIAGFLFIKERKKTFLLISVFFAITFFLVTANITDLGFEFYKRLFYIPAFSMFRVFYAKWMYIFLFFYSLLFGFSTYVILSKLKQFYAKIIFLLIISLVLIPGIPLFSGDPVNKNMLRGSDNVKTSFIMDSQYEQTLAFIRGLPDDGKILLLPLTDFYLQIIYGKNGGAYEGPSTLRHLTTKYSFAGYQHFGYGNNIPYAEDVMKYSREKNYDRLLRIFTILNIRYILHNSDSNAYENNFSKGSSYAYMQTSLPKTQDAYREFIARFPVRQIYKNGQYAVYQIDNSAYNPTIFIPEEVYLSNKLSYDKNKTHAVFFDKSVCDKSEFKSICKGMYKKSLSDISFEMVDPTLYKVTLRAYEATPQLLVMQHTFNSGWKLVSGSNYIAEDSHVGVNGYANAWLIPEKEIKIKGANVYYIKLDSQKYFWYGLFISFVSLITIFGFLFYSFFPRKRRVVKRY